MSLNNSSIKCSEGLLPAYEVAGLVPTVIALLLVTVVTLFIHVKAVLDRVDLSHPVFAVILQDLMILSFCGLLNLLMLGYVACTNSEHVYVLSLIVSRLAMQFHSVAWLVVTILR